MMFFDPDFNGTPHPAPVPVPGPGGPVVWVRNKFFTGLAVAAPLILTYWILEFVYDKLHGWSVPLLTGEGWLGLVADRFLEPVAGGGRLALATLLAAELVLLALFFEGVPHIEWSLQLVLLLLYGGVCGNALAYWAMAMVNRSLPAATTSLGLLATPVVGTLSAIVALGETVTLPLLIAMILILGGIALGTIARARP